MVRLSKKLTAVTAILAMVLMTFVFFVVIGFRCDSAHVR